MASAFTNVPNSYVINAAVSSATYVAFADQVASAIVILNNTGEDINVRQDRGPDVAQQGLPYLCPAGTYYEIDGISNCNQVSVARAAGSGAITVQARYFG